MYRAFIGRTLTSFRLLHCRPLLSVAALSIMASTSSSSMATRALSVGQPLTTRYDYDLPIWAKDKFQNAPLAGRLHMAHLPTPLYQWTATNNTPSSSSSLMQRLNELGVTLYIKRDDMTGGCETGGNKIRKLEFLLAEALHQGFKKVVTIGGEQSNHCRATAAACRMVGLEPHLILRTKRADEIQQAASSSSSSSDDEGGMGYTGNILFDRLVGSSIYTCTPGEYGRVGSKELVSRLCARLEAQTDGTNSVGGGTVYPIPVGGSNGLGTFGYIDGVDELLSQWNSIQSKPSLDHVLFACGSGGTAAGITVGMALAFESEAFQDTPAPSVHAMGVCDSPDYFYKYVASIADEMGLVVGDGDGDGGMTTEDYIRKHMIAHQGKGLGYAASTPEELEFISTLALETGVVLDPVYSGKALYHFFTGVLNGDEAESYRGKNILFWHTGGALGMFDKANDLLSTMDRISKVNRLDIYGKGGTNAIDISQDTDGA